MKLGELTGTTYDENITSLAFDARAVRPGALFFCLVGRNDDGHEYLTEAVRNGAVAAVVERLLPVPVPHNLPRDFTVAFPKNLVFPQLPAPTAKLRPPIF